jgi:hypothetical protein
MQRPGGLADGLGGLTCQWQDVITHMGAENSGSVPVRALSPSASTDKTQSSQAIINL